MNDTAELSALHTAVNSYLSTLLAIAECVGKACPEVGGPFRHRLSRLRSRLAYDTSPDAIAESNLVVERELADYATRTSHYVAEHGNELRKTVELLENIVKALAQRQEFYCGRLRQFAEQMETSEFPADAERHAEVMALQAIGLLGCVESMSHETESLVDRMHTELAAVAKRLQDAEVTDRLTGLMNRREMERQIGMRRAAGEEPVLVVFELSGDVRDEVARQAALRLGSQFRHRDLVCRWTENEFMVMFQGKREIAISRTEQVIPLLSGKYLLDSGETVDVSVDAGVVASELTMQ